MTGKILPISTGRFSATLKFLLERVATGEWDSNVEGGASIRVFVCVPDKVELKKAKRLSGEESKAYFDEDSAWMKLMDSPQFKKCYWYGAIKPKEGWHRIVTQPDIEHRVRKKVL